MNWIKASWTGPFACSGCGGGFHSTPRTPAMLLPNTFSDAFPERVQRRIFCRTCGTARVTHWAETIERLSDGSLP